MRAGVLILAVPVASDLIVWNVHRVYGRARLRLLLKGWKILHVIGLDVDLLRRVEKDPPQPVFVLQKMKGESGLGDGGGDEGDLFFLDLVGD